MTLHRVYYVGSGSSHQDILFHLGFLETDIRHRRAPLILSKIRIHMGTEVSLIEVDQN